MWRKQYFILAYLLLVPNVGSSPIDNEDIVVDTDIGSIRGLAAEDGDYFMFMGIPYAQVDKDNPFGISIPYPAFEETYKAYDDSVMCPQLFPYNETILGTLDCLRLNVYVPSSASADNPLPVMVYVHGGLFSAGFAGRYLFGPKYLVQQDVIVVTFNYRVGPYGFMCLGLPEVPGNQGLKDQILAFRWINNHIEAFGGDSNQITVFGQSSGGHSIDLHLISPQDLLFNKVILQSGSATSPSVLYDPDCEAPFKLAQYLGLQTTNMTEALSYLASAETNSVINASTQLDIHFKPCVEVELYGVESFISYSWIDTEVPKVKDIPVLLGFNENESAIHHTTLSNYTVNMNLVSKLLNQTFCFEGDAFQDMKSLIGSFYFGDAKSVGNRTNEVIQFESDYAYIYPVKRTMLNYLESGAPSIFYYMFSYLGGTNAVPNFISHSDELPFLFDVGYLADQHIPADDIVIQRMTTMWTNFAKYGDPTPEVTELLPVKWLPVTKDFYYYLKIDTNISLHSNPVHERLSFWDLFYDVNREMQNFFGFNCLLEMFENIYAEFY